MSCGRIQAKLTSDGMPLGECMLKALHAETLNMMVLSPEIHDTLRQMSIYLTHG